MDDEADIVWTARRRFWQRLVISAETARALGDRPKAIAAFEAALDHAETIGTQDWRPMARTLHGLGRCQEEEGDLASARGTFERLIDHEQTYMERTDAKRTPALVRLCWVLLATDQRDATPPLLTELRAIVTPLRAGDVTRRGKPDLLEALSLRMVGEVFGALDRLDEAVDLLSEAVVRLKLCVPPGSGLVVETRARLAGVTARREAHA